MFLSWKKDKTLIFPFYGQKYSILEKFRFLEIFITSLLKIYSPGIAYCDFGFSGFSSIDKAFPSLSNSTIPSYKSLLNSILTFSNSKAFLFFLNSLIFSNTCLTFSICFLLKSGLLVFSSIISSIRLNWSLWINHISLFWKLALFASFNFFISISINRQAFYFFW